MKRLGIGVLALALVALGVLFLTPFGNGVRDLFSTGIAQSLVERPPERKLTGDTAARLKALKTALDLYHDSEERYPEAVGWTEAARLRLKAHDLAPGEELKGLTRPGAKSYGYALNRVAAGKYRDDIGAKGTILLYETSNEAKDATGDPKSDGLEGGRGVTLAGEIVPLR